MCSIGEDDFGDEGGLHAMISDKLEDINTNMDYCLKCGTKGALIKLKFRDAECTNCFLAYARHKFRATLGSSKVLPKGAELLLLFDGSPESLVLLDMMHFAQSQNTYKRLHVNTRILFIDETSINPAINIREVATFLGKYNFEAFIIALTDKDSLHNVKDIDLYLNNNWNTNSFVESLKRIKTLTSRQDFLKVRCNNLIEIAATQLKCNFAFSPDISTHLATDLLNSIALGRGGSAALDVSLLDNRFPGLKIIRPLRTLNAEEVQYYLNVNKIKVIKSESYGATSGPNSSIQNLTKCFVDGLQANFSSTISTVFRTGDKIAPNTSNAANLKCFHCSSRLGLASKTLLAIEFSRLASSLSGNLENCQEQVKANDKLDKNNETEVLCHACANIVKDCEEINLTR